MRNTESQAELLRRWVEALRSGDYQQGHGRLHRDGAYCCLGVLCDVSGAGKWEAGGLGAKYVLPNGLEGGGFGLEGGGFLPTPLRDTLSMTADGEMELVCMNDQGAPFTEIATEIEKRYPDVFGAPTNV